MQQDRTVVAKIKKKGMKPPRMTDICFVQEGRNMVLYGLKTCDTCRKALKLLPEVSFVDVRSQGVPDDILGLALSRFGRELVNTRSATWRKMSETERACPPIEQLRDHPTLMKRPLIAHDGQLFLGWNDATRAALGLGSD